MRVCNGLKQQRAMHLVAWHRGPGLIARQSSPERRRARPGSLARWTTRARAGPRVHSMCGTQHGVAKKKRDGTRVDVGKTCIREVRNHVIHNIAPSGLYEIQGIRRVTRTNRANSVTVGGYERKRDKKLQQYDKDEGRCARDRELSARLYATLFFAPGILRDAHTGSSLGRTNDNRIIRCLGATLHTISWKEGRNESGKERKRHIGTGRFSSGDGIARNLVLSSIYSPPHTLPEFCLGDSSQHIVKPVKPPEFVPIGYLDTRNALLTQLLLPARDIYNKRFKDRANCRFE